MSENQHSFIEAVGSKNIENIKELITEKIDINFQFQYGYTALHYAVLISSAEIVKLLLSQDDIKINIKTSKYGYSPLHIACDVTNPDIEIVEMLIKKDPSLVDITDNLGHTPLIYSIPKKRLDLVKCLVENGADVNYKDPDGQTCLHFACRLRCLDIINYLLDNTKIDPRIKDDNEETALWKLLKKRLFEKNELFTCKKLIDKSFTIDPVTQHYKFGDFCEYAVNFGPRNDAMREYFIHNFYSKNNKKYHLIERIEKCDQELKNCLLFPLVHDQMDKKIAHKYLKKETVALLRVHEELSKKAIESDEMNILVRELFEFLNSIGLYDKSPFKNLKTKLDTTLWQHNNVWGYLQNHLWYFEHSWLRWIDNYIDSRNKYPLKPDVDFVEYFIDEFAYFMVTTIANMLTTEASSKRFYKVIKCLSKIINIDEVLEKCLDFSELIHPLETESLNKICLVLLPFTVTYHLTLSKLIDNFRKYSIGMEEDVTELLNKYHLNLYSHRTSDGALEKMCSLKHLSRETINKHLMTIAKSRFEFFNKLEKLAAEKILPKSCVAYLRFDNVFEV